MEAKSMKIYFEEIPVQEDQPDGVSMVQDASVISNITLKDGGELQEVRFGESFAAESDDPSQIYNSKTTVTCQPLPKSKHAPPARGSSTLCHVKNSLFLFGGANRQPEHFNDLFRFDMDEQQWHKVRMEDIQGKPPSPRSGHSAVVLGTCVVIFGGMNLTEDEWLNDVHVLQTHVGNAKNRVRWHQVATSGHVPTPRAEHTAVIVGGHCMVVFGGSSPMQGVISDVHILNLQQLLQTESSDGRKQDDSSVTDLSGNQQDQGPFDAILPWTLLRCRGKPPAPREMHAALLLQNQPCGANAWAFPEDYPFNYGSSVAAREDQAQRDNREDSGEDVKKLVETCRSVGNNHFVAKDFELAAKAYSQAIDADGEQFTLLGNRSACYLNLGDHKQALRDAQTAIRINPSWGKGFYREASVLKAMGEFDDALAAIQHGVELAKTPAERNVFVRFRTEIEDSANSSGGTDASRNDDGLRTDREGHKLLIHGGRGESGVLGDISILDLATQTWSKPLQTPFPRCGHTINMTSHNQIHMFGGTNESFEVFASSNLLDLESGMWTDCNMEQHPPGPRFAHAACCVSAALKEPTRESPDRDVARDTVFVFGGVSIEKDYSDAWMLKVPKFSM